MTPLEILKSARELLSDEARWTKWAFATPVVLAKRGDAVSSLPPSDPEARCFCVAGALMKAGGITSGYWSPGSDVGQPWDTVLDAAFTLASIVAPLATDDDEEADGEDLVEVIAHFNDSPKTKHADVLAVLDKAIAIAEVANA